MANMSVESMKKSSTVQGGNLAPLLGQDVVPPLTPTDCTLSKKQLLVLVKLFEGLLHNTCSPDARQLSVSWACSALKDVMSREEAEEIANKFMAIRQKSPMDILF
jgi:hypothetical protein